MKAIEVIRSKDDSWFEKSYRLPRRIFYYLLDMIRPKLETKNKEMAIISSGSPLEPEVLLAATLRYLAGGSYVDIVDLYLLPYQGAHRYFWKTMKAIDEVIDNIRIPKTPNEWRKLNSEWNQKMEKAFVKCYLPGTVFSIDGIVIETKQPHLEEVRGDIIGNMNRKGYFGMVALSAVDVWGRFIFSELAWSGSTNDSVAYHCTALHHALERNELPPDLHGVADEAFCASSPQILTPYSRRSLRSAKVIDPEAYRTKRTFNYLLSYQRCTVERSFGIMVRKFLILGRCFECSRSNTKLIFKVCSKLHNLYISDWLIDQPVGSTALWNRPIDDDHYIPDVDIMEQLGNDPVNLPPQPRALDIHHQGPRRDAKAAYISSQHFIYED
jgi:hypothetical protein